MNETDAVHCSAYLHKLMPSLNWMIQRQAEGESYQVVATYRISIWAGKGKTPHHKKMNDELREVRFKTPSDVIVFLNRNPLKDFLRAQPPGDPTRAVAGPRP